VRASPYLIDRGAVAWAGGLLAACFHLLKDRITRDQDLGQRFLWGASVGGTHLKIRNIRNVRFIVRAVKKY
jgi:hypothetical protein